MVYIIAMIKRATHKTQAKERRIMATYTDETGKTVKAKNYQEAAVKLYGQKMYKVTGHDDTLGTTYAQPHRNADGSGYATVYVYQEGDKQGTYWGVQAATPERHTLTRN